ncbi:MAG: hypothetical protein IH612_12155 [Desulfofustis sp.]|nr:hypothetical protein [Desulfofustis sp.]
MTRLHVPLIRAAVFVCLLGLAACSSRDPGTLPSVLPATDRAEISFEEQRVPSDCSVFAQMLITIPPAVAAEQTRQAVEQFAADSGADLVLLGLARQSAISPETVTFRSYGPRTPYPFATKWTGWKFGFADWNKGGPLVDFGINHLSGDSALFTIPIDVQAVLLSCPSLRSGS